MKTSALLKSALWVIGVFLILVSLTQTNLGALFANEYGLAFVTPPSFWFGLALLCVAVGYSSKRYQLLSIFILSAIVLAYPWFLGSPVRAQDSPYYIRLGQMIADKGTLNFEEFFTSYRFWPMSFLLLSQLQMVTSAPIFPLYQSISVLIVSLLVPGWYLLLRSLVGEKTSRLAILVIVLGAWLTPSTQFSPMNYCLSLLPLALLCCISRKRSFRSLVPLFTLVVAASNLPFAIFFCSLALVFWLTSRVTRAPVPLAKSPNPANIRGVDVLLVFVVLFSWLAFNTQFFFYSDILERMLQVNPLAQGTVSVLPTLSVKQSPIYNMFRYGSFAILGLFAALGATLSFKEYMRARRRGSVFVQATVNLISALLVSVVIYGVESVSTSHAYDNRAIVVGVAFASGLAALGLTRFYATASSFTTRALQGKTVSVWPHLRRLSAGLLLLLVFSSFFILYYRDETLNLYHSYEVEGASFIATENGTDSPTHTYRLVLNPKLHSLVICDAKENVSTGVVWYSESRNRTLTFPYEKTTYLVAIDMNVVLYLQKTYGLKIDFYQDCRYLLPFNSVYDSRYIILLTR